MKNLPTKTQVYEKAINLIAKVPTIIASWQRIRNGLDIVDPDCITKSCCKFPIHDVRGKTRFRGRKNI